MLWLRVVVLFHVLYDQRNCSLDVSPMYCLSGASIARLKKQEVTFNKGDAVFDLSGGLVDKITYSFLEPRDIVTRSISRGFSSTDPMMKVPGLLRIPSVKDRELRISSAPTGARFISDLNDVRRVTKVMNHQVK